MTSDLNSTIGSKKKPVCVIHTGAEEVFTFNRLVDYGRQDGARYQFSEIIDELHPWSTDELTGRRGSILERISNEEYIMLLAGENTARMAGTGLQAIRTALYMRRPIIAVNLDGSRCCNYSNLPKELDDRLVLCISSEFPVLEYALDSWRDEAFRLNTMDRAHAAVYSDEFYTALLQGTDRVELDKVTHQIAL